MNDEARTSQEAAEREAPELRARLADTLNALDGRLRDLFSLKAQARKRVLPLALVGTGALLVLGGAVSLAVYRSRQREQRMYRERWRAIKRFWTHPHRFG